MAIIYYSEIIKSMKVISVFPFGQKAFLNGIKEFLIVAFWDKFIGFVGDHNLS